MNMISELNKLMIHLQKRFVWAQSWFSIFSKKIISGVDLKNDAPMNVPDFHSSIFPGNLIHGAAKNNSMKLDFL